MQPVRHVSAFATIAFLALLAALPWGIAPQSRFFLPMLPVVAIHFWTLRHPGLVPEWNVFLIGLALDVLTHGPLGYWALVYLTAHLAGTLGAPFGDRGILVRIGLFAAALVGVVAVAWAVASVYFLERADIGPYMTGALLAAASSAILLPLLHWLAPELSVRDNALLRRGV